MTIYGNIEGVKKQILQEIENLEDLITPPPMVVTAELVEKLVNLTEKLQKELAIYIDRKGRIQYVAVGSSRSVSLEAMSFRRGANALSGLRCIHTHPNSSGQLSQVDLASLEKLKLDLMMAIGVSNGYLDTYFAILDYNPIENVYGYQAFGPLSLGQLLGLKIDDIIAPIEKKLSGSHLHSNNDAKPESALLVGVDFQDKFAWPVEESLKELEELTLTAGAVPAGQVIQKRQKKDPKTYIGMGKVEDLALYVQGNRIDIVIFDDELSPSQQRNLELLLGVKVIDRTGLILDIFAQRAISREGKLQVELAQLKYLLPRLIGFGQSMSRLGGGIGTRGPGETKLEQDRRRIRQRISDLEKEVAQVKNHRVLIKQRRQKSGIPQVAIVGYTNAGKSTLLNQLTGSEVLAEDMLFATLDPTTRKITLPNKSEVLLTDTVGFIQKLPHNLIAAFKATLEESLHAELLLLLVDGSHSLWDKQIETVEKVLSSLGVDTSRIVYVINKIDKITDLTPFQSLQGKGAVAYISASEGKGLDNLLLLIEATITNRRQSIEILVPYSKGDIVNLFHIEGKVDEEAYLPEGIKLRGEIPIHLLHQFDCYLIDHSSGGPCDD